MAEAPTEVGLYFDPVSPYSYLALWRADAFAEEHGIRWLPRPVVYAALLDAHRLVGPVEVEVKRRYTFADVQRCARLLGAPLQGPPAHPFRSLEALRTICLFLDRPEALPLSAALASAAWADGRALTDPGIIADVVAGCGLDAEGLEARIAAPAVKERLRELTSDALEAGVFGVPTFELEGELFWGHDRLDHLAARLSGRLPPMAPAAARMAARPRGADRPGRPRAPGDEGS